LIDDLFAGTLLSPRTYPHWGRPRPPDVFVDEETVVEDRPREAVLRVVKQLAVTSLAPRSILPRLSTFTRPKAWVSDCQPQVRC
jgi:hypothetical protein